MADPVRRRPRAPRMAPDDRRTAIVTAALPLFAARGPAVSTADIAAAAGVAEGTIFRVFPDKDALVIACLEAMSDTSVLSRELEKVGSGLTVDDAVVRVAVATTVYLSTALTTVFSLSSRDADHRAKDLWQTMNEQTRSLLEVALTPYAEELSVTPARAARTLYATLLGTVMTSPGYAPSRRDVREAARHLATGITS